jgi:hypothetical protein
MARIAWLLITLNPILSALRCTFRMLLILLDNGDLSASINSAWVYAAEFLLLIFSHLGHILLCRCQDGYLH